MFGDIIIGLPNLATINKSLLSIVLKELILNLLIDKPNNSGKTTSESFKSGDPLYFTDILRINDINNILIVKINFVVNIFK